MNRGEKRQNVVLALYPGCISFELALAAELLSNNFNVVNASPDGKDLADSSGINLKTQISYSQINVDQCAAILVPGGDPRSIIEDTEIDRALQRAKDKGILIAAICAGPSVLAKAGILVGKRIAHGYGPEQIEFLKNYFKGVTLTDELFVADGNILTAKPEAHIDFAVEIACRLGSVDASKSGRTKEYYRGTLGRKIRPLALAVIKNKEGKILLHKAYDILKKETFYRPLGGGIEFGESGEIAIVREIDEELGLKVKVDGLSATFENIFVYEGKPGHEIVLLFDTTFNDPANYSREELDIVESGKVISKAVWRSVADIKSEDAKLYPSGIEKIL